jgi:hypothetical protein
MIVSNVISYHEVLENLTTGGIVVEHVGRNDVSTQSGQRLDQKHLFIKSEVYQ